MTSESRLEISARETRILARLLVAIVVGSFSVPTAQAQLEVAGRAPNWLSIGFQCVYRGDARMMVADEEANLFSFSCNLNHGRLVFMLNLSNRERSLDRGGDPEPLVPIFSSNGRIAAIPSLVVTLPGDGTTIHSNRIPPNTIIVFRPIRQHDIRPHGLEE